MTEITTRKTPTWVVLAIVICTVTNIALWTFLGTVENLVFGLFCLGKTLEGISRRG